MNESSVIYTSTQYTFIRYCSDGDKYEGEWRNDERVRMSLFCLISITMCDRILITVCRKESLSSSRPVKATYVCVEFGVYRRRKISLPLALLYSTLLYSTLLYSTLLYSTLLYSTLLYSTLLHSTLLYSTLLYSSHFAMSQSSASQRSQNSQLFDSTCHLSLSFVSSQSHHLCLRK